MKRRCRVLSFLFLLLMALASSIPADAQNLKELLQNSSTTDQGEGQVSALPTPAALPQVANGQGFSFTLGVLSDLHVSKKNKDQLQTTIEMINQFTAVESIAVLGDLCEKTGDLQEYQLVKRLLAKLQKPILAIPGNHDIIYKDALDKKGKKQRATPEERKEKLDRFARLFRQDTLRFFKIAGGHLLVFLPIDGLKGESIVKCSDKTIDFLRETLRNHPDLPTVVFCHATLEGSYALEDRDLLTPLHACAQPADEILSILRANPQVFLWVSGHRHVEPTNPDFMGKINKVGNVTVVNIPDIDAKDSWLVALKLTPSKAVVKTFQVEGKKHLKRFDRVFEHGTPGGSASETAVIPPEHPAPPKPKPEPRPEPKPQPKPEPKPEPVTATPTKLIMGVVEGNAPVRVRMWPWGKILGELRPGKKIRITGTEGDFFAIDLDGKTRFIHRNYVTTPSKKAGEYGITYPRGCSEGEGGFLPKPR